MSYLRKFESFQTHDEIHKICEQYEIKNYTINSDGSVDVNGDVNICFRNLDKLPLKFNHIYGDFICSFNELTTLDGAPKFVDNRFVCSENYLTTLDGAPQSVGDDFICRYNKLTTLYGSPKSVGGSFNCQNNHLTTLEGSPQSVNGNFICRSNELVTLKGSPQSVRGSFDCSVNPLMSLKYLSPHIYEEVVHLNNTPIYEIFKLLGNDSFGMIGYVNMLDVVVDDNKIDFEILSAILYDLGIEDFSTEGIELYYDIV